MCEFSWRQVVCPCKQGRFFCSQICYGVIDWNGRSYHILPFERPRFAPMGRACIYELSRLQRQGVRVRDSSELGLGRIECPYTEAYYDVREAKPVVAPERCAQCTRLCLDGDFRIWGF